MNIATRTLGAAVVAALAFSALPAAAQGHHGGFHGGGHGGFHGHGGCCWVGGPIWGGLGIGLGIGLGGYYGYPYPAYYPGYVVVDAPPATVVTPAVTTTAPPGAASEPVIYPRNGQSPAQTESDRQECNRWATTQQRAMADASVFQRAVAACLDGRGYTVR